MGIPTSNCRRRLRLFGFVATIILVSSVVGCSQSSDSTRGSDDGRQADTAAASSATADATPTKNAADQAPETQDAAAAPAAEASAPASEQIDLLRAVPVEVVASSAYRSKVEQIQRLADGDMQTAWNSDSGDLQGAWIGLRIPENAAVTAIEMTAGFTKQGGDRDLFTGNYRVRRVRVFRGQEQVGEYPLDIESRELQRLPVSGPGGFYRIELIEMVGGSHASWREACISELRVLGQAPGAEAGSSTPRFRLATPEEQASYGAEPTGADAGVDAGDGGTSADSGPPTPSWDPPVLNEAGGLRLTRISTCVGVEAAQPVDPRRTFSQESDERVYCFFRLENPESIETQVTLSWEQPGAPAPSRRREVDVPARNRFGYYAYITTGHRTGRWQCVIRTSDDEVLGSIDFDINAD